MSTFYQNSFLIILDQSPSQVSSQHVMDCWLCQFCLEQCTKSPNTYFFRFTVVHQTSCYKWQINVFFCVSSHFLKTANVWICLMVQKAPWCVSVCLQQSKVYTSMLLGLHPNTSPPGLSCMPLKIIKHWKPIQAYGTCAFQLHGSFQAQYNTLVEQSNMTKRNNILMVSGFGNILVSRISSLLSFLLFSRCVDNKYVEYI